MRPRGVLYDCKDGTKKAEFAKKEFRDPWPIVADPSVASRGVLQVAVKGQQLCVKAYTVETNKPVDSKKAPDDPKKRPDEMGPINPTHRAGATKG